MPVYFIRAGENGPIKIGCAMNVGLRRMELQAGNHERLHVIRQIEGLWAEEAALHKQFAHLKLAGEWFTFDPAMMTAEPTIKPPRRALRRNGLRDWLKSNHVSVEAFARTVGVTPEAVRLWCLGLRTPRWKAILAIREATKGQVDLQDFEPEQLSA